jgi:hypothetical protein
MSASPDAQRDILGEHVARADAWLERGFGSRLSKDDRLAIRRVLFTRAWQAKADMTRDDSSK